MQKYSEFNISHQADFAELSRLISKIKHRKFAGLPNISSENVEKEVLKEIQQISSNDIIYLKHFNTLIGVFAISPLVWDTQYFGFNCGKVSALFFDEQFEHLAYEEVRISFLKHGIHDVFKQYTFIFADIDAQNPQLNNVIQKVGFDFILSWIDGFYTGPIFHVDLPIGHAVGLYEDNDFDRLIELAKNDYFRGGRFYFDNRFKNQDADRMYEELIKNLIINDIVYVYRINEEPVAFFASKKIISHEALNLMIAPLRLLVTDGRFRGMGIGVALYQSFLNYLLCISDIVTTGLEIHNIPSLNMHAKIGFKYNYVHNAYHFWRS